MSTIATLQNLANFSRLNFEPPAVQTRQVSSPQTVTTTGTTDLQQARRALLNLYRALEAVADSLNFTSKRLQLDLPDARSNPGLSLNLFESAATLGSTEEINASADSFSPFGPNWSLGSTSLITLGGEYRGSLGTTTLTFDARRGGTRFSNNLQIRVTDGLGGTVGTYNIQQTDPLDQRYSLVDGLFFTVGAGDLVENDLATAGLFQGIGSAVDPDKPLAGTRNDNPNFQYYEAPNTLPDVVDGSFDVNGETIAVTTTDTINTVIGKINASAAGVTAQFNAASETIEFMQNTAGSQPTIDIQNDTSNFTTATKLDGARVVAGVDSELNVALQGVDDFSAVQAGSVVINGESIAVDPGADSLATTLDRINSSDAGVAATFDSGTQVVTIESTSEANELTLDSNGTNLFQALNIPEGRVDPKEFTGGISRRRSYQIARTVEALVEEVNTIFKDSTFNDGGATVQGVRAAFASLFGGTFSKESGNDQLSGIVLNESTSAQGKGNAVDFDLVGFAKALQFRGSSVKSIFNGQGNENGLIQRLFNVTLSNLRAINSALGRSGIVVDTVV